MGLLPCDMMLISHQRTKQLIGWKNTQTAQHLLSLSFLFIYLSVFSEVTSTAASGCNWPGAKRPEKDMEELNVPLVSFLSNSFILALEEIKLFFSRSC